MSDAWDTDDRRGEIERILQEMGAEGIEGLEEWDGEDLDALRGILDEEQYETLLDRLSEDFDDS